MEAMASGTLVAGYDSVGGRELLRGEGPDQNCLLAPMGDYLSLAYAMEPVLAALIHNDRTRWVALLEKGLKTTQPLTRENEAKSLVDLWQTLMA